MLFGDELLTSSATLLVLNAVRHKRPLGGVPTSVMDQNGGLNVLFKL